MCRARTSTCANSARNATPLSTGRSGLARATRAAAASTSGRRNARADDAIVVSSRATPSLRGSTSALARRSVARCIAERSGDAVAFVAAVVVVVVVVVCVVDGVGVGVGAAAGGADAGRDVVATVVVVVVVVVGVGVVVDIGLSAVAVGVAVAIADG